MNQNFTAEEVRAEAAEVADYGGTQAGLMLTAYAERIEADERAVPVWLLPDGDAQNALAKFGHSLYAAGVKLEPHQDAYQAVREAIENLARKVVSTPPAQAAQVGRSDALDQAEEDAELEGTAEPAAQGEAVNLGADAVRGVLSDYKRLAAFDADETAMRECLRVFLQKQPPTQPHSPDAADSGRVNSEVVAKWFGQIEHELTAKTLSERNGDQCWKFELRAFVRKCQAALAAQPRAVPKLDAEDWAVLQRLRNALPDVGLNGWHRGATVLSKILAAVPSPDGREVGL